MLLKTRFYLPPLREQSVLRNTLIDKLNQSTGGQLVLISAPAGYGKSTLVSQWLHHTPHTFAWLTLDKTHNSPLQFWRYILNALQGIQPTVGVEAKAMIESNRSQSLSDVVISLLNDLDQLSSHSDSTQAVSLVLDDFHLLENKQLISLISLFLDHLPSGIRLVITSREEPSLSLARRRANNQLVEFNIKDLAFNYDESSDFFTHSMALKLAPDTISSLHKGTEGWIAGLQLAALSIQGSHSDLDKNRAEALIKHSSLDRHIEDYLFEEVFSQQAENVQLFLMLTSAPSRFCAGLANALTSNHNSQSLLLTLEQANLFLVPLDNHRTWYRYHDLFRQFLLQRLKQLPLTKQADCHRSAGDWFEQFGYIEEAIEQHIINENWEKSVCLINEVLANIEGLPDASQLTRWTSLLPGALSAPITARLKSASQELAIEIEHQASTPVNEVLIQGATPLTQRESEVLSLVTQGLSNKLIAEKLHISLNTLKVHIRNLYGKIGVESRTQALVKINQHSSE
ncbi:helix-turn-helix transcriptional regulator [Alkalimarinus alittae]|uniref:LuxR C-terminal-related transcriptional regulator n=1 Tax=Alkalimarinus alittae TaxID=2961619 RepID=A0ABY6N2R2_9ALTE|nr:LuxR family transcriptional regulator [Alkalimarinus alittae]UZE96289.1 LuxR C-terminal-related transcriptional regulator [Alkalimarinus alittae]